MDPYQIAKDTYILPHTFEVPGAGLINVNSMIIAGREPVIVDTGSPLVTEEWQRQAWSLVDPAAVRWVFLSHDDGDHLGSLDAVLSACPNAKLVTGWFAIGRLHVDHGRELPVPRCMWINDGDRFVAGDRTLLAIRPPVFDAPTTRGLFDTSTGVYWGSDSFGMFVPSAVEDSADIPENERWDSFNKVGSLISPWLQWVDRSKFSAHVDTIERLGVEAIATCHGPGFRGALVGEALRRMRDLPSQAMFREPDQAALEAMLAQLFAAGSAVGSSEPAEPAA